MATDSSGLLQMRQREPRKLDPGYLAFLRKQPCCVCHRVGAFFNPIDPAHIRIGLFAMQMKPDDAKCTPLCREDHDAQHAFGDEQAWWHLTGLDPFEVAAKLYAEYGGTGGSAKPPRKIKPRKPVGQRTKIKGRTSWPKRSFR